MTAVFPFRMILLKYDIRLSRFADRGRALRCRDVMVATQRDTSSIYPDIKYID